MKNSFCKTIILLAATLFIVALRTTFAVSLEKVGDKGYTAIVEVPRFVIKNMDNGFVYLKVAGGYLPKGEVGKPAIPGKMFRLAIGKNKKLPEISAVILEKQKIVLSGKLHPLQSALPSCRELSERVFRIDSKYYETEGKKERLVSLSRPFVCHGVPGVEITLKPFSYNPVKNVLTVVKRFKLDIIMPEGISAIPAAQSKTSHSFVRHIFKNYDLPLKTSAKGVAEKENYLIIAAPEFKDNAALDSFVTFREQTYNVTLVTTSEAGSDEDQIKSYIQNMYDTDGLTYVLLVGNRNNLPYFTSGPASFWQYGLIDGNDNYTDVHVGVFCVRNETSLGNIVHKTVHTERNIKDYPDTTTIYSTFKHEHMVMQCDYIRRHHWEPGGWKVSWMVPDPNSNENYTSDLRKQINNNNTRFVSYEGHGSSTGWQDGLNSSDVRNLTNREVYPFVWGYACSNGTFQNSSECFAETWIGAESGAVMFTGASTTSSSYQKALNVGMARSASHEDDLTTIGQIFDYGKTFVFDSTESIADSMQFVATVEKEEGSKMYNLFGDPACKVKYDPTDIFHVGNTNVCKKMVLVFVTPNKVYLNIPEKGRYDIAIFTADGQKMQEIVSGTLLKPGKHTIKWNGIDLSSGIYFVRVNGALTNITKKFVLIR